ncbi:glycosyltransferase family 2 protein [Variovorax paradoxus]|jgi:glycosyltransferase involved in cell wall biosynthesis|uniref:glycosyltransferase family 2 protein n=1 Tax=Variovorax paradoxus TaxID=34073 RepID=UPI00069C11AE|nr:glycosyltransferase family 2 protein [Variovorax paradoxus]
MFPDTQHAIAVVIPTFNRRERLERAVQSVLQETRVPIVLHIFDNASTDDTEGYARELSARDARVVYTRNAANIGGHSNYAKALDSVEAEYFVPLADDDYLLPDFLHDAYGILEAHESACAAVFLTQTRTDSGAVGMTYPEHPDKIRLGLVNPHDHMRDWLTYGHYSWSSVLWRSKVLAEVGAPYLHVGLPSDVDFQTQIFCTYPVYIVNRLGAVYTQHEDQASMGYDLSHIKSWGALFKRLDRAVLDRGLFSVEEYLPLRAKMQQRYRSTWNIAAKEELDSRQLVSSASAAGFRLGDWPLAFSLIDTLAAKPRAAGPDGADDTSVLLLPEEVVAESATPSRPQGFLASVLWSFKAASAVIASAKSTAVQLEATCSTQEQALSEQKTLTAQMQQKCAALEADLADQKAQTVAARAEADAWHSKFDALDARATALQGTLLFRILRKLRLMRL